MTQTLLDLSVQDLAQQSLGDTLTLTSVPRGEVQSPWLQRGLATLPHFMSIGAEHGYVLQLLP